MTILRRNDKPPLRRVHYSPCVPVFLDACVFLMSRACCSWRAGTLALLRPAASVGWMARIILRKVQIGLLAVLGPDGGGVGSGGAVAWMVLVQLPPRSLHPPAAVTVLLITLGAFEMQSSASAHGGSRSTESAKGGGGGPLMSPLLMNPVSYRPLPSWGSLGLRVYQEPPRVARSTALRAGSPAAAKTHSRGDAEAQSRKGRRQEERFLPPHLLLSASQRLCARHNSSVLNQLGFVVSEIFAREQDLDR